MGNHLIYKNVNSNSISGLLISELGDITRPSRRQDVTEVEGRDGDVVRYLGYEPYKKNVTIGLHGDFDIDEISNFFGGEGELILSNEPTKVYQARVVDTIDFERLIRWRTATVSFIVQPYKKLLGEQAVESATSPLQVENKGYEDSLPTITVEGVAGEIVTLKNGTSNFATVTIPPEGTITLDGEAQNCYNDNADKNQYVVGDFAVLKSGVRTISWTGNATKVIVQPNSRWL